MKHLKNLQTNEIIKGEAFGSFFDNWIELTENEILAYELQEAKTAKLAELNKNRNDFCLIPIEYQDNAYATTINAWAAISYLANGLATLSTTAEYPNYPQGDNITLTKADFKAIAGLIQTREMASRDLRKAKITEINACTTVEEVNAINIIFE